MLEIRELAVRYGTATAVSGLSLEVGPDETVALLGPSGCGKSTLLRAIAGLESIAAGSILLEGADLSRRQPHERGIGMMFQSHALFPHRDVEANVEFGLRMAGMSVTDRRNRVAELLELVGLPDYQSRDVTTLSGGEAQRVALARSLAPRPRVLLLDEPFGSLDRSLRDHLVDEIPPLLREAGIAAIHVTHDHAEAFGVGDRVAVMIDGRIVQAGDPEDVWRAPGTAEIARFMGHKNIIEGPAGASLLRADAATIDPNGDVEALVDSVRFREGRFVVDVRLENGTAAEFVLDERPAVDGTVRLSIDDSRRLDLG